MRVSMLRSEKLPVRPSKVEVLAAVTGRGVDKARAGVVGDVVAGSKERRIRSRPRALQRMGAIADSASRRRRRQRSKSSTLAAYENLLREFVGRT